MKPPRDNDSTTLTFDTITLTLTYKQSSNNNTQCVPAIPRESTSIRDVVTLPGGACTKYAPGLEMCTGNPISPVKFDINVMKWAGAPIQDNCTFCKAGKDPKGDFKFSELWEDRGKCR